MPKRDLIKIAPVKMQRRSFLRLENKRLKADLKKNEFYGDILERAASNKTDTKVPNK